MSDNRSYASAASSSLEQLSNVYGYKDLENPDKVLLMDGWNKILGFETMFKEALWFRWRIVSEQKRGASEDKLSAAASSVQARQRVEQNEDSVGQAFGSRRYDAKNLLLALFDDHIRTVACPHLQVVQREAYRPVATDRGAAFGLVLEETKRDDIVRLFNTLGVTPDQWLTLITAFLWTMESQNPYGAEEDYQDLALPPAESVYARAAAVLAKAGIQDGLALREEYAAAIFREHLPAFWEWVKANSTDFGAMFYKNLLTDYEHLLDYFTRADMDSLTSHIKMSVDLMTRFPTTVGEARSPFRTAVDSLGWRHKDLGIPTNAYPSIGMNLIKILQPFASTYCTTINQRVTPVELQDAMVKIYSVTMSFTFYPMLVEELKYRKAEDFFRQVAIELGWSAQHLSKRLLEAKLELNASGTYRHTSEEIELGARLAWRNSAKCIGRISWNTLLVRDCRHVDTPEGIIHELQKHLEIATAGTNLQSVMTVFPPRKPDEPFGIRFWSDQLVRYACYEDEETGALMGDRANKELTKYLLQRKLWTPPEPRTQHDVLPLVFRTPPEPRTQHDVLPLVFRMPGRDRPVVHQFDAKYVHEAPIAHPDYPDVAKLGHKWASVPAINTFNMNLGGVDYGCMPFNGWFCSVEIVRDIMERYEGANEKWAKAMGIDPKTHRMWKARVAHEIDVAVLHSFEKAGYTIVDPETVGEQFMSHCTREREAGRECPAQWSWIGGLTGPINKTWHKEMRDFRLDPQYEYTSEIWSVTGFNETLDCTNDGSRSMSPVNSFSEVDEEFTVPRVLIAYGSETGTAESVARRLAQSLRAVKPVLTNLNKVAGLEIIKKRRITHILVLCSTFGNGQPPTSALKFMDVDLPAGLLRNTEIATLALGSSMYPDFCHAGIAINKKLLEAGGNKMMSLTLADQAVDSTGVIANWIKVVKSIVVPPSLEAAIAAQSGSATIAPLSYEIKWQKTKTLDKEVKRFVWPEGQASLCLVNEELFQGGDIEKRSTRRIGFRVPEGASYVTGDHLCVHPLNHLDLVRRFAACFIPEFEKANTDLAFTDDEALMEYHLQQPFEIDCVDNGQRAPAQVSFDTPITLAEALQTSVNLSLSEASVVDVMGVLSTRLSEESKDSTIQKLKRHFERIVTGDKSKTQSAAMTEFLSLYPTVVDLLETIVPIIEKHKPSMAPIKLAEILAILPRLQPRLYSISSSSAASPDVVEVSVGVVNATTDDGVKIKGVCSTYLAQLIPNQDKARISIRTSGFRAPEDLLNTPMILVGAGTGLAPMMGFLRDRALAMKEAANAASTATHLFYGCRTADEHIYRDTTSDWSRRKVMNLHVAVSRDPNTPKKYVQHMIRDAGPVVCELMLRPDTTYYVCGDARMADFCFEALIDVMQKHGGMSRSKARNLLKKMQVEDRYNYDLWGVSSSSNYADVDAPYRAADEGNRALMWLSKMKKSAEEKNDW